MGWETDMRSDTQARGRGLFRQIRRRIVSGPAARARLSLSRGPGGTALLLWLLLGPASLGWAEPLANTQASIDRGKELFMRNCTECHGADGKAQLDVVADATDLTEPAAYLSGSSPEEIFRSINEGAGVAMPAFNWQLGGDPDIWNLVNYVRSLWPEGQRPPLVAE